MLSSSSVGKVQDRSRPDGADVRQPWTPVMNRRSYSGRDHRDCWARLRAEAVLRHPQDLEWARAAEQPMPLVSILTLKVKADPAAPDDWLRLLLLSGLAMQARVRAGGHHIPVNAARTARRRSPGRRDGKSNWVPAMRRAAALITDRAA